MRSNSPIILLLSVFLVFGHLVYAQDSRSIQAKIIDNNTGEPIPFATVRVLNGKSVMGGVVSNQEGDFRIPSRYQGSLDFIVVTCIGYADLTLSAKDLSNTKINLIKLKTTSILLHEVVVTSKRQVKPSARKIIQRAIQNIPQNYPSHPFAYVAYYRDYQKEENEYVNMNEAIVGVADNGFQTNDYDSTRIKLYKYVSNNDFRRDTSTIKEYDNNSVRGAKFIPTATVFSFGGNELLLLRMHDAIRNYTVNSYSFVNELRKDFLKNHSFKLEGTTYLNDVPLYRISFQSLFHISGVAHIATGEIFIEHGCYAIHKLVYSTFLKDKGEKKLLYSINLEYAKINSFYYLNYISFNNIFQSRTDLGFKVNDVLFDKLTSSFLVTFNHAPQRETALDEKNYDFKFNKTPLKVKRVVISKSNDRVVEVKVEGLGGVNIWEEHNVLSKRFEAGFKNIKDMEGRSVNEIVYKQVNQFRELFFQKNTDSNDFKAGPFMSKEMTLEKSRIDSSQLRLSAFWMNTPLIK